LAEKPPACLEYIILHELLHLSEHRHNDRFVTMLDKYMPQWREVRKTLNGLKLDWVEKEK
ncbi:MAG: M48 family metallopeptidase, partial [Schwartzia sp.]|nr:M48 family metallopeptidase [Schwartzia sp. (in: firmicutes)]